MAYSSVLDHLSSISKALSMVLHTSQERKQVLNTVGVFKMSYKSVNEGRTGV